MDTNQNHRMIVDPDEDNYLLCFFPLRSIAGFKKVFFGGEGVGGGGCEGWYWKQWERIS